MVSCENPLAPTSVNGPFAVSATGSGSTVSVESDSAIDPSNIVIRDISAENLFAGSELAGTPIDVAITGPAQVFKSASVRLSIKQGVPLEEVEVFTREAGAWVIDSNRKALDPSTHTITIYPEHFSPKVALRRFKPSYSFVSRVIPSGGYRCLSIGASISVSTIVDVSGSSEQLKRESSFGVAKALQVGPAGSYRTVFTSAGDSIRFDSNTASFPQTLVEALEAFGDTDIASTVRLARTQVPELRAPIAFLNVVMADVNAQDEAGIRSQIAAAILSGVVVNVFSTSSIDPSTVSLVASGGGQARGELAGSGLAAAIRASQADMFDSMKDSDSDGISDCEETNGALYRSQAGAVKTLNGLNAQEPDTDHDLLYDSAELRIPTLPSDAAASFSRGRFVRALVSNPTKQDTDGDLVTDGQEIQQETEPTKGEAPLAGFEFLSEAEVASEGLTRETLIESLKQIDQWDGRFNEATNSGLFGFLAENTLAIRDDKVPGLTEYQKFGPLNRVSKHDTFKKYRDNVLGAVLEVPWKIAFLKSLNRVQSVAQVVAIVAFSAATAGALVSSFTLGSGVFIATVGGVSVAVPAAALTATLTLGLTICAYKCSESVRAGILEALHLTILARSLALARDPATRVPSSGNRTWVNENGVENLRLKYPDAIDAKSWIGSPIEDLSAAGNLPVRVDGLPLVPLATSTGVLLTPAVVIGAPTLLGTLSPLVIPPDAAAPISVRQPLSPQILAAGEIRGSSTVTPFNQRTPYETALTVYGQVENDSCVAASCVIVVAAWGVKGYPWISEPTWRQELGVSGEGSKLADVPPLIHLMFVENPAIPAVEYSHQGRLNYNSLSFANKRAEVQILASRVSPGKPAIVGGSLDKNSPYGHAVVVERVSDGRVYIIDPGKPGSAYSVLVDDFVAWWDGDSVFAIS
jgi:hypothetical protein